MGRKPYGNAYNSVQPHPPLMLSAWFPGDKHCWLQCAGSAGDARVLVGQKDNHLLLSAAMGPTTEPPRYDTYMHHPFVSPGIRQRTHGHRRLEGDITITMTKPGTENILYTGAAVALSSSLFLLEATDMGDMHCHWLFLCWQVKPA